MKNIMKNIALVAVMLGFAAETAAAAAARRGAEVVARRGAPAFVRRGAAPVLDGAAVIAAPRLALGLGRGGGRALQENALLRRQPNFLPVQPRVEFKPFQVMPEPRAAAEAVGAGARGAALAAGAALGGGAFLLRNAIQQMHVPGAAPAAIQDAAPHAAELDGGAGAGAGVGVGLDAAAAAVPERVGPAAQTIEEQMAIKIQSIARRNAAIEQVDALRAINAAATLNALETQHAPEDDQADRGAAAQNRYTENTIAWYVKELDNSLSNKSLVDGLTEINRSFNECMERTKERTGNFLDEHLFSIAFAPVVISFLDTAMSKHESSKRVESTAEEIVERRGIIISKLPFLLQDVVNKNLPPYTSTSSTFGIVQMMKAAYKSGTATLSKNLASMKTAAKNTWKNVSTFFSSLAGNALPALAIEPAVAIEEE